MKTLISILLFIFCTRAQSQEGNKSLPDSVRKYFNYDTLYHLNCKQTPIGIYSLSFKVDKIKTVYDVHCSCDSLPVLKGLLVSALKTAIKDFSFDEQNKYLLLIYYNNYFGCYNDDTSSVDLQNVESEVNSILNGMLVQIDKTFATTISSSDEYVVLKTVEITNTNPSKPKPKSFVNDSKTSSEEEFSSNKIERIKKEVERRKKEKSSN